jgi:hypothetical protein
MTPGELSESEQVVLLSLVGLFARADGRVSASEMTTLEALRAEIDPASFDRIRDAAARLDSAAGILSAAEGIRRPEARSTIYDVLIDMALPHTIQDAEGVLFDRLAALWGLQSPLAR